MYRTYLWVSSCLRNASQQTPALFTPIILFTLIGLLLAPLAAHTGIRPDPVISPDPVATLELEEGSFVEWLSFSPDGTLLAGVVSGEVQLWDVASRQQIAALRQEAFGFWSLSFSPDGTLLATGGASVRLWDVASRKQIATLELEEGSFVEWLSFSPDGTLLAVWGRRWDEDSNLLGFGKLQLWDVASRQQIPTLYEGEQVRSLSFSPDGTLLAGVVSGSGEVQLWDVASRQQIAALRQEAFGFWSLSFSPDGTLLAIGGWGADDSEVQLWDVASRRQIATLELEESSFAESLSFSPDGTLLAVWVSEWDEDTDGWFSTVQLWDVASRQQIATVYEGRHWGMLSFSPDGTLLTGGGTDQVPLWDVSEFKPTPEADDEPAGGSKDQGDPESDSQLASLSVTIDDVTSAAERDRMTFTVRLEPAPTAPTTVKYATASRTAKGGQDYEVATGTLRFGANQNTATFTVRIRPDEQAEPNETFAVRITHPSTGALLAEATGTITDDDGEADEPQARLTPNPAEIAFSADDPAWKTFTVHTSLDSVLVRANPPGSDLAIEVVGGQQVPTRDFCPAEGNDRPTRARRDGWSLHVKACQAGQTKILLIDYDTGEVLQQYEVNVEGSGTSALTALNPSYPNPFNSETTLSYTLSTASAIRLEVFTLNGQRVAVLHDGFQVAGYHTIAMDAADLASGVYLYRLTTPEGRFAQKFTLLR